MQHPDSRGTIFSENATVIDHKAYAGEQYVLRLRAPKTAAHSRAGSFVHLQCDAALPMRRPMSIMRADADAGWIDILYKSHGEGTRLLARRKINDQLGILGPIGVPFKQNGYRRLPLLIGGGVGMPPMIYLAEHLRKQHRDCEPFVILGSEVPFPFKPVPSTILVSGIPGDAIAAMPLLEDWQIASRLTSQQGYPGCHQGLVTDLAREWISARDEHLEDIEIFACGPTPMLRAVAHLAQEFELPCQVSLEEYMACAVGGCAGCAVRIETAAGPAMKRVCVDGPVFEGAAVFPRQ